MEVTERKRITMKNVVMVCFVVVAALAVPTFVQAQDAASGTLTVNGTVVSSISLTIDTFNGATLTGAGTDTASTDLGTISKFGGTLPTGVTRTRTATNYKLSSNVGVTVVKANSISTAYTLNAKLSTAPAAGLVWHMEATALNAATVVPLTAAGVWGSTPTYAWDIVIDDSFGDGSTAIDNVIEFSAISG